MINVIASVRVKAGKRSEFLEIFMSNIPHVRKEKGCIEYFPTVDVDTGMAPQVKDENVVTIIEKWESMEALGNHLRTPHMLEYREKVKDIVEDLSFKVLREP